MALTYAWLMETRSAFQKGFANSDFSNSRKNGICGRLHILTLRLGRYFLESIVSLKKSLQIKIKYEMESASKDQSL